MSPAGHSRSAERARRGGPGFTLIELILVMAVLAILLTLAGPTLGRFFRGRALDSEARRFVSLTRYAESRAVSEGVPVLVWIDVQQRMYGVTEEPSGTLRRDPNEREYELHRDVNIDVLQARSAAARRAQQQQGALLRRNATVIRFQPDGLIGEGGPDAIAFRQVPREGQRADATDAVWVARSYNGLHYEIPTNQLAYARQ